MDDYIIGWGMTEHTHTHTHDNAFNITLVTWLATHYLYFVLLSEMQNFATLYLLMFAFLSLTFETISKRFLSAFYLASPICL